MLTLLVVFTLSHVVILATISTTVQSKYCFIAFETVFCSVDKTSGHSNLTKSASRGAIPRLGVIPRGRNLYH